MEYRSRLLRGCWCRQKLPHNPDDVPWRGVGFDQTARGSGCNGRLNKVIRSSVAKDYDGKMSQGCGGTDQLKNLEAVIVRQLQIKQHQVGATTGQIFQG